MIPTDLLERCRGVKILLVLIGNSEVEGIMVDFDSACNIVLRDATSFRTLKAAQPGEKDSRETTGEFSSMFVPNHAVQFIVPGGAQPGQIVTTVAEKKL